MRVSAGCRFGLTRLARRLFHPSHRAAPRALGAALVACALAGAIVLASERTAVALPTAALVGAQQPVPATQFGADLRGHGVLEGRTPRRILHFTFDDGPDAVETPRLLDALDRYGMKATFFFSTSRFDPKQKRNGHAPGLAREIARRGHQLGVHGFDHLRMARMRPKELAYQVAQTEAMFARVFGTRTFLFRPPFGSRNRALDAMLAEGGYVTAMWNIGVADWVKRTPEEIRSTFWRVVARNERSGDRGGIVLMHDTHDYSVDGFIAIAESIRARNCELLAAGEELYDVVDSLAPWVHPPSDAEHRARQSELQAETGRRCGGAARTAAEKFE